MYLSVFFLMEHLCRSEVLCSGLWELYEYMTGLAAADDTTESVVDT